MMIAMILGALVGAVAGLTGAGGGILAVPLLMFSLPLTLAQAAPIGLLAAGCSAALGALMGLRDGIVRYRAAALIATAGALLSPAGLWTAARVPTQPLIILFAGLLVYVAWRSYRKASLANGSLAAVVAHAPPPCVLDASDGRLIWTIPCARVLAGCGLLVGFLSGLLGVGGGFLIVPALQRYTDLDLRSIVPTSLAVIALVSVAGVASSAVSGGLDWSIALPFSGGSLLGMAGGRMMADQLSGAMLQKGFAVMCLAVAVALVLRPAL